MIHLGQQGHLLTKTVELEKVKRNRAALDIKAGLYLFMRRLSCIISSYESEQQKKDFEIVKVHFVTGKHTGLSGVRSMCSRNRRDAQVF